MRFFVFVSLLCLTFNVTAAVVEAIQEQAFLERGGTKTPLQVGQTLRASDYITTGENARVVVRLVDKSLARVGQSSRVKLAYLKPPAENNGVFGGKFNVLHGVFRFTSTVKGQREVEVQVGRSITAGIRGTDLFVMAGEDKDWFCMIEGEVQVKAGKVNILFSKHRQYLIVPKTPSDAMSTDESLNPDVEPLPMGYLDEATFEKWIHWTELSH